MIVIQMKKVMISITSTQDVGGEVNSVELMTEGEYSYSPEKSELIYQESSITGMAGTTTTFTVEPDTVILTRVGTVTSQMLFRRGEKHLFLYETPYGNATMGIYTRRLERDIGEGRGHVEIEYTLDVDNINIGVNQSIIDFKEI